MGGKLPLDDFERTLRSRIERMIRDLMGDIPDLVESTLESFKPLKKMVHRDFIVPESDIHVKDDMILAVIQIPGSRKESIDVRIRNKVLELEAELSEELVEKASGVSIFRFRGYRCTLDLPREVDPNMARAIYQEGILVLELPTLKPKGIQVKIE